jgi:hypothetical protein
MDPQRISPKVIKVDTPTRTKLTELQVSDLIGLNLGEDKLQYVAIDYSLRRVELRLSELTGTESDTEVVPGLIAVGHKVYDHNPGSNDWRYYAPGSDAHGPVPAIMVYYVHGDTAAAAAYIADLGADQGEFYLSLLDRLHDR